MDTRKARERVARTMLEARKAEDKLTATALYVIGIVDYLVALDEDIQKIRKELRSRNGGGES